MLKKNNKGFMLMETLLVSVFIASTLIFLYIQFQKVRDSYQTSFSYNTVIGTYSASNFLNYLKDNGIENLSNTINSGTVYIDLTTCPSAYLTNTPLCKKLVTELGIKKVIYASSDTSNLITRMDTVSDITPKFKSFIKSIKVNNRISYRLLFEFNDETYSTVLARKSTVEEVVIHTVSYYCTNCYISGSTTESVVDGSYAKADITVVPEYGYDNCEWSPFDPKTEPITKTTSFNATCVGKEVTPPFSVL